MATDSQRLASPAALAAPVRRHDRKLVRVLIGFDLAALAAAAGIALALAPERASFAAGGALWVAVTCSLVLVVLAADRSYDRDRLQIAVSTLDEIKDFVNALSFAAFLDIALIELAQLRGVEAARPLTVVTFWLAALVALPVTRGLVRHTVVPLLDTPQNTLIIGAGRVGQAIAEKIRKHPEYNLRIVGFLDDEPHPLGPRLDDLPVVGAEDDLVAAVRRHRVSRLVLAFSRRSHDHVLEVIRQAGLRDVHLSVVPRYFEIMASNVSVTDVEGIPVLEVPPARLSRLSRATKRAFDLVLTVPGLLLISPLMLGIAVAIKLESRGPVFFRQLRRGRGESVFRIFKFRTMVDGAEQLRSDLQWANEVDGPLFKIREDPRVTRVGAWLRKLSLDELPQLFNVLSGEMSLVGPRPFVVHEDEKIGGWARQRLDLSPGITGLWQVLGRNEVSFEEMVKLDYLYVHNWSLWWDVKLLLRTLPIVLRRRGF